MRESGERESDGKKRREEEALETTVRCAPSSSFRGENGRHEKRRSQLHQVVAKGLFCYAQRHRRERKRVAESPKTKGKCSDAPFFFFLFLFHTETRRERREEVIRISCRSQRSQRVYSSG